MSPPREPAFAFPDLTTARVQLRVLTQDDTEAVQRHFSDDEVTRYMDIDPCSTLEQARQIIAFHQSDPGCRWGLFSKSTGQLIGTCGYHAWERDRSTPEAEIGYDLGRTHWGAGLMSEVLHIVIPFGFDRMGLGLIYAGVESGNERSIRLLERLGFRRRITSDVRLPTFDLYRGHWTRTLHAGQSPKEV